ncbi:hypothetical protein V8C44DRAFT_65238 [Trichoderma aethiopicum]
MTIRMSWLHCVLLQSGITPKGAVFAGCWVGVGGCSTNMRRAFEGKSGRRLLVIERCHVTTRQCYSLTYYCNKIIVSIYSPRSSSFNERFCRVVCLFAAHSPSPRAYSRVAVPPCNGSTNSSSRYDFTAMLELNDIPLGHI